MTFSPQNAEHADLLLERYVDGELRGEELAWIQRRLEVDADLKAQVLLQRRIDDSIRRTCPIAPIPFPATDPPATAR